MKALFFFLICIFLSVSSFAAKTGEVLKHLPVQDSGRIKPYDTFAREMLELVYGKSTYEGRAAHEIIFTWMLSPQLWQDKEIFEVRNGDVLRSLGLPEKKRWYRPGEIFQNDKFQLLMQELQVKRQSKEKLTPYFQALQRLENQFFVFQEIAMGRMLRLVPPKEGDTWISVADLESPFREYFFDISKAFVGYVGEISGGGSKGSIGAAQALDGAVLKFIEETRAQSPSAYANDTKINLEVHYNDFHPFRWAYIFYLLTSLVLLWLWTTGKTSGMTWAWGFLTLGFILHTYGFFLRIYLAERPPVSNMYETVVWVAWGAVVFAAILEWVYKFRFTLLAGSLVSLFSLIIADSAPVVLDPSLQPLEAVLRSSYWLIVHVMTITISYAAFFLAFVLGDIGLIYYLRDEVKYQQKIKSVVLAVYRAMQIGVVFLAPGIILGGIWADYSWGRFWGWDPKETWALIVLLGYLAVLHGRLTNWIRDFGMLASAVLTFSLVIMAWYGVNFILGAGLHSYGFGAGGVEYVSAFVVLHLLFVIYTYIIHRGRSAQKKS